MRKIAWLMLFLLIGCSRGPMECSYSLLESHNMERAKKSIAPLAQNSVLDQIAQDHAKWMAQNRKLTHQDIKKIPANTAGENIACGQQDVAEVMYSWMHSSGHRANILNARFSAVGFGQATASDGQIYWCADFAGE